MKILTIFAVLSLCAFISCKGTTNVTTGGVVSAGEVSGEREIEISGVGVGRIRDLAILSARAFLAEQVKGIDFVYSQSGFSTSVKNVHLRGSEIRYIGMLNDGKTIVILKMKGKIVSEGLKGRYLETVLNIKLGNLLKRDRSMIYESVVKKALAKSGQDSLKGKIYLSLEGEIKEGLSYDDFIKLKITVVY
jgi:hypothetical protein